MYYWIIYDISKDKARNKVAKSCKQAGLRRVQKSVFLGVLRHKQVENLRKSFNRYVNWHTDKVFFVPMSAGQYAGIRKTGRGKGQMPLLPPPGLPSVY